MAALELLDSAESKMPHPFTILTEPAGARIRILGIDEPYRHNLPLPLGEYRVEISADGYGTVVETVRHEPGTPAHRVVLRPWAGGEIFRDCPTCPEMVVIPAGRFRMGCLSGQGCSRKTKPVHDVVIEQPFALSKYEVTIAEWNACVATGGCNGYDRRVQGSLPVTGVSWDDARAYVSWLSGETGKSYRLPSEAEWEYAARAGTATRYHFGNDPEDMCRWGNVTDLTAQEEFDWIGRSEAVDCRDGHAHKAPVGSFASNAFGLHDMHGNVYEWVEDCWNRNYDGAPVGGEAWTQGNCAKRVYRSSPYESEGGKTPLYVTYRESRASGDRGRSHRLGFRVARSLPP